MDVPPGRTVSGQTARENEGDPQQSVPGEVEGAVDAEWKCKQRVWASQLACDALSHTHTRQYTPPLTTVNHGKVLHTQWKHIHRLICDGLLPSLSLITVAFVCPRRK